MKKTLLGIVAIVMASFMSIAPVFAAPCTEDQLDKGCVNTAILGDGCSCDDGSGSSVTNVLDLVVDIMTIGVGILGVIGITVTGIQYLTAGGSEEKATKAKRRMFEIVIGLLVYVLIYSIVNFLVRTQ